MKTKQAPQNQILAEREYLREVEAAFFLGVSRSFLRQARMTGRLSGRTPGPPFYKIGRMVRYRVSDLQDWLSTNRIER